MEFAKVEGKGSFYAMYSSTIPDDTPEELSCFHERVNDWASSNGVVLDEGWVKFRQDVFDGQTCKRYIFRAPIRELMGNCIDVGYYDDGDQVPYSQSVHN